MSPYVGLRTVSIGILALAMILSLEVRGESPVEAPVYRMTPNPAPAERPFTLRLLGAPGDCRTFFKRESVTVSGNRIDLSFLVDVLILLDPGELTGNPGQIPECPEKSGSGDTAVAGYDVPTYDMPALKAGSYEVWATEMLFCHYSNPPCKAAVIPRFAGTLLVEPDGRIAYEISPKSVEAGKEFDLSLLSYQFNCATTYDMLASAVVGDTLSLTFLDHADSLAVCPAVYKPYGPSFKIRGLREGRYRVVAYRLPQCAQQGCRMAPLPEEAGILTVTGPGDRKGWFLERPQVPAEKAFSMRLLNHDYGNCQTGFSGQTLTIEPASIRVGFAVENHPERICVADIRPHGPTFEMPAMKPGAYPVYVEAWPACVNDTPSCRPFIENPLALVDTLIVSRAASVLPSSLRAGAKASASFAGGRVRVNLPDGPRGDWKADLFAVTGRRLASADFRGEGGSAVIPDFGPAPERGVYRIRLRAPDGKAHTLPLVRGD